MDAGLSGGLIESWGLLPGLPPPSCRGVSLPLAREDTKAPAADREFRGCWRRGQGLGGLKESWGLVCTVLFEGGESAAAPSRCLLSNEEGPANLAVAPSREDAAATLLAVVTPT